MVPARIAGDNRGSFPDEKNLSVWANLLLPLHNYTIEKKVLDRLLKLFPVSC